MNDGDSAQRNILRRCPVCLAAEARPGLVKGALRLVQCLNCHMVYANPVEFKFASGAFYDEHGTDFYLSPDKLAADYASVRYERELGWFRRFCPKGQVLDVGCSSGAFLHQLQTRFGADYAVVGTDVSRAALNYAESRGITVIRTPFLEHDFLGQKFEAITFWAVLEHVLEPVRFLNRASELLRPGGHLFILVPNLKSLAIRLLGARYRYLMPDHINYFTGPTLLRFIQTNPGLECLALSSCHFNPAVIIQDLCRKQDRVDDAQRIGLLKKTTALKQNPWLMPLRKMYAASEQVLAHFNWADNLIAVLRKNDAAQRLNQAAPQVG